MLRRLIGCLKLQVMFRKMTYEDKAPYASTPACTFYHTLEYVCGWVALPMKSCAWYDLGFILYIDGWMDSGVDSCRFCAMSVVKRIFSSVRFFFSSKAVWSNFLYLEIFSSDSATFMVWSRHCCSIVLRFNLAMFTTSSLDFFSDAIKSACVFILSSVLVLCAFGRCVQLTKSFALYDVGLIL